MGTVDFGDLNVFVKVVETASFTSAAKQLGLPKSSVSRSVARLEEALGTRLLYRTTRKVAPSTAGQALHDQVCAQIASLRQSLGAFPEREEQPSGRLRITAAPSIELVLAEVVARLIARYPAVEVELVLTTAYVDLVAESIDICLRFATKRLKDSTLTARKLGPSYIALYAAPSYLTRRGVPRTPGDLAGHDWVIYKHATRLRLENGSRSARVETIGRITSDDMGFHREAIIQGCGIGYLTPLYADAEVAAGRLLPVLPKWRCQVSNLWALWPGGPHLPPKASAFLELLVEAMKTRPL